MNKFAANFNTTDLKTENLKILFLFLLYTIPCIGQQSDSLLISYLEQEYGITTTRNNQIKLLKSGHEKFECLFDDIKKAKHHIHLEYFNFRNDSIANLTFELLAEKAKEGVEVRAIFDAFGNSSNNQPLKKKHLKAIRENGIEIVKFDPFKFPYINHAFHRDHRKIVVIDGTILSPINFHFTDSKGYQ